MRNADKINWELTEYWRDQTLPDVVSENASKMVQVCHFYEAHEPDAISADGNMGINWDPSCGGTLGDVFDDARYGNGEPARRPSWRAGVWLDSRYDASTPLCFLSLADVIAEDWEPYEPAGYYPFLAFQEARDRANKPNQDILDDHRVMLSGHMLHMKDGRLRAIVAINCDAIALFDQVFPDTVQHAMIGRTAKEVTGLPSFFNDAVVTRVDTVQGGHTVLQFDQSAI